MNPEVVFESIPRFHEDSFARAEFQVYMNSRQDIAQFSHPVDYWYASASEYPKLSQIALACLSVPVGSVAAERSFSMYSKVLADDRHRIADENLRVYNMLYHNSGAI